VVLLILALLVGSSAVSDDAIRQQAARCGLSAEQLIWSKDTAGNNRADIPVQDEWDSAFIDSLTCMIEWAKQTGARVGFISRPPPTANEVATLYEAGQACGLPDGTLAFERNEVGDFDIRINRVSGVAEERISCALNRLPTNFDRFGLGPLIAYAPGNQPED